MSSFSKQWFATLSLAAIVAGALVTPVSAAAVGWTGASGSDVNWSTPGNWSSSPSLPTSSDDVTFAAAGASGTVGALTNDVTGSMTISTLWYTEEQPLYHTTQIDAGATLKIQGNAAASSLNGLLGNYSLMAGTTDGSGTTTLSQTVITGDGTLDVSSSTGGNTGGDIVVRQCRANQGAHRAVLDLSGLATFAASVDQLLVGYTGASPASSFPNDQRATGTLYLAKSNTITINNTSTSATGKAFYIGYATGNANNQTSYVYLGQSNVINVDKMW